MPITLSVTPWRDYRDRTVSWNLVDAADKSLAGQIREGARIGVGPMRSFVAGSTSDRVGLYNFATRSFTAAGQAGAPGNPISAATGGFLFDFTGYRSAVTLNGGDLGDSLVGGSGADTLSGAAGMDTLRGGAGNDTYRIDDAGDLVLEARGQGNDTVLTSVSYALAPDQEIETLRAAAPIATQALDLTGNNLANALVGNAGANRLDGGAGIDSLTGGAGNDTYVVDNVGDRVFEAAGGGSDTVQASVSYALAAGQEIEALTTTDAGGTAGIALTGNAYAQTLVGNAGANRLDGGGGADTLIGGAGSDSYVVDNAGERVIEDAGGGDDTVVSSVGYSLGEGQEIETLQLAAATGTRALDLAGNAFGNRLVGNAGRNRLDGGAGADTLQGGQGADTLLGGGDADLLYGGQDADLLQGGDGDDLLSGDVGADSLYGGAGDDTYVVDNVGDRVFESAGAGNDTVRSAIGYALAAGQEIEALTTTDAGGTAGIALTGNAYAQTLVGNAGANRLDGGGGADTLIGGAGSDTYVVDDAGERVIEAAGEGDDTVVSSVGYSLGEGQEIETLQLAASTGTQALDLAGNEFSNTILGNAGANRLDGGAGIDRMFGGAGDDTYLVDAFDDYVGEAAGGGFDAIYTTADYCFFDGQEIELLVGAAGDRGLHLMGNEFAQSIIGAGGDDALHGDGGADTLIGGGGADTFVFLELSDGAPGPANCLIADFVQGQDQIFLAAIQAVAGASADQAFDWTGTDAFDGTAGALRQRFSDGRTIVEGDVDGDRAADIQFALAGQVALTAADFIL